MQYKDLPVGQTFYMRNKKSPGAYPDRLLKTEVGAIALEHHDFDKGYIVKVNGNDEVYLMVG